jgi:predicted transcriptional regulator
MARVRVRDIMTRDVVSMAPGATVAQLAERFWRHHRSFPVVDKGMVLGIASVQELARVPREEQMQRRVDTLMRPLTDAPVIGPHPESRSGSRVQAGGRRDGGHRPVQRLVERGM